LREIIFDWRSAFGPYIRAVSLFCARPLLYESSAVLEVTNRLVKGVGIRPMVTAGDLDSSATGVPSKLFGFSYQTSTDSIPLAFRVYH
jgi:hypothetical protein